MLQLSREGGNPNHNTKGHLWKIVIDVRIFDIILPTTLLFQSDLQYIIDTGITIHIMALWNVCRVLVDGR